MTDPHYPHKCPKCGAAAYVGATEVECSGSCRHGDHMPDVTYLGVKSNCPTPEEYVGELLRIASSDLVDSHLATADGLLPGDQVRVEWDDDMWDVDVPWAHSMAKEIRRRLGSGPIDTNPKTGLKYSQECRHSLYDSECKVEEVHVNAGQLGLLEEAHEALGGAARARYKLSDDFKLTLTHLASRISKSLCSVPDDTVQVPREVLVECRKLAHLEWKRIRLGADPPGSIALRLEKKMHSLWKTLKGCL